MIRPAQTSDYPVLIEFGRRFYASLPYADIPYCEESASRWLDVFRERGVLLIAEVDGQPVGMAAGLFSPFIFNDRFTVGQELFWWVEPEYRSYGIGREILADMELAAQNAGCIRWSMIAIEGTQDRVGKLYEGAGYAPAERTYTKRP